MMPSVRVLDPSKTKLVEDTSPQHRGGLLYLESLLQDLPHPDDKIVLGHEAALDLLPFQLEPAQQALSALSARILIADALGLGKTLEAGILLADALVGAPCLSAACIGVMAAPPSSRSYFADLYARGEVYAS